MKFLAALMLGLVLAACDRYKVEELTDIPQEAKDSIQKAVDGGHRPGVVIALINPNGTYFYSYGSVVAGENKELSADSQFAIGSLTKLFTVETFQQMVEDETLSYTTKANEIWPAVVDGSDTQLWHLASHKAALPRKIPFEALANNDAQLLLATLNRSQSLPAEYEYSNAGMAILALSLAKAKEKDIASLMAEKIINPLGLKQTSYQPDAQWLVGMHRVMEPVKQSNTTTVDVARGAGGLYSTARDLAKFIEHQINTSENSKQNAYNNLGWKKYEDENFVSYYHGGDGNGNQGFVGYRPDNKVGIVLLSNSSADDALQQVALHFLDPTIDLPKFDSPPARQYTDEELAPFVGVYYIKDDLEGNSFTFQNRDGRMIYIEETAEGELVRRTRMYGMNEHQFKLAEIPLTIKFSLAESKDYDAVMKFQDQEYYLVKKKQ